MTKVRYTINDRGELEARDGTILGRVVGLTLDVGRGGAMGGSGDDLTSTSGLNSKRSERTEGGAGETSITDASIAEVWAYWCERRQPRRRDLELSQARLIRKGLNASFTVDELKRAIDALLASEWHKANGRQQLSAIFATRPGGPTLRDQIEGWIERSPGAPASRSDILTGKIEAAKKHVRFDDDSAMFTASVEFLASHGITVAWHQDAHGKRYPVFEDAR
jgi:hypothetical protein